MTFHPNPVARLRRFMRSNAHISALASGSVANGVVSALGVVLTLAAFAWLARTSGAVEFGIFSVGFSWLTILALLSGLGADQALLRMIAALKVQKNFAEMAGILAWARALVWRASVTAALVLGGVVWLLGDRLDPSMRHTFWIVCLALPPAAQASLRLQALRSLRRYALGQIPEKLLKPLLFTAVLWGLHGLSRSITAVWAMAAMLIGSIVSLWLLNYLLRRCLPAEVATAAPRRKDGEWLRTALPLLVISGVTLLLANTDIVMLGWLAGAQEAGMYTAANRIAGVIAFGLLMVNTVAAPLFSELYVERRMADLQRLISFAAAGTSAIVVLAGAGIVVFGADVLRLFGDEFSEAYGVLLILCAGQLVNAVSGSVGYLLAMTGHQNIAARVLALSALLNVVGNLLLIPRYGMLGAATTTVASIVFWNLIMVAAVRKRLHLHPTVFSAPKLLWDQLQAR